MVSDMGGCQKYGPFLGTLNIRGRSIIGIQERDHDFDIHPYGFAFAHGSERRQFLPKTLFPVTINNWCLRAFPRAVS